MKDLFDARVHLGHKLATDQMRPFIYGNRFGVNIIDLDELPLQAVLDKIGGLEGVINLRLIEGEPT